MPAPVPPGYTRGPILLIGTLPSAQAEATLLQRFWSEAGGYGARLLLLSTLPDGQTAVRLAALFQSWESESVTLLPVARRHVAQQTEHLAQVEQATAILLLADDPLALTRRLGGTALAQALRRANARGKVVAALGTGATALCQHALLPSESGQLTMTPGFGLVNRLGVAVQGAKVVTSEQQQTQLSSAVAANPFLIGVGLAQATGIVVYPNATLEVFGGNHVAIVDGTAGDEVDPAARFTSALLKQAGWQFHHLSAGYTFNFDQHTVHAPPSSDIPLTSVPRTNLK